ncbi:Arabidopsis Toxicos en Levadura 78 [Hibiscus trionum]|uniref:RING-type E3 ubiquitin transferase n=1 Tax=Hibiscus trionum TaxID=183268 RepID=A0A9W7HY85_HIBTR|nr:Arabidopsis Toxicos en Levadura 78 [Hibiscus trionum]
MTTSTTTSTHFSPQLLQSFHPRKFLLHETPAIPPPQHHTYSINNYLHTNAPMFILLLICTIFSFCGLFCILKRAVRGSISPSPKLADVGVERKALNAFPVVKYATELKPPALDTACVICLSCLIETDRKTDNCSRAETLPVQETMNREEN